jgi:phosphatidylinositol alpha-mannosyltransferase
VLWIAGDGPETESLRRRHPGSDDIRWLGVLSEEDKLRRLASARVLCAPSLGGESFGIVVLEAMAARTVAVASDIPGYREAAGGHAVLVPPGDDRALAETLARVLSSGANGPGGDGPWLDAAAEWASHWSMDRLAGWYEHRYRSVVAGPAR